MTYDDTKVLSYAYNLGMMSGKYVFILVEGVHSALMNGLEEQKRKGVIDITDEQVKEVR